MKIRITNFTARSGRAAAPQLPRLNTGMNKRKAEPVSSQLVALHEHVENLEKQLADTKAKLARESVYSEAASLNASMLMDLGDFCECSLCHWIMADQVNLIGGVGCKKCGEVYCSSCANQSTVFFEKTNECLACDKRILCACVDYCPPCRAARAAKANETKKQV